MLSSHHNRNHKPSDGRPHPCHPCGEAFLFHKDLARHEKSQKHRRRVGTAGSASADRLYCPDPGCRFHVQGMSRKDNLRRHQRKKHPELESA